MISNTGRKVRADAKLEQLDATQRELLHFWFEENFSYYEVVKRVQQHFGLTVSRSAVAAYWKRHILPQRQQDDADGVAEFAALPAGDFNAAILQRVWALAWAALAQSHPDIDKAAKLLDIVRKAERQALAVRRLELEERRVALREKLAKAELVTTKHTKRNESSGGAAEMARRCEHTEVAAKAPRSETSEMAENRPRFPGYSETIRLGSAGVEGRGEHAELAAKARSCEGLGKGPEEAICSNADENGSECRTAQMEQGISNEECDVAEEGSVVDATLMLPGELASSGDASIEEAMARLDEWERELDQIDDGEADGMERLAVIARDAYAHLIRFTERHGLGGARVTQIAANLAAPDALSLARLAPIPRLAPGGGPLSPS